MNVLRSLAIAFTMYSRIPAPRVKWEKEAMSLALCFFPLIGAVIGALMCVWCSLAGLVKLGAALRAAGLLLIPIAVSGGVHMDGFADVSDALGSRRPRERKLEILKDSHTGAFAVITVAGYMILFFAAWCAFEPSLRTMLALAITPVLSRALSALGAMFFKNARGEGLLATFTDAAQKTAGRVVSFVWIAAACAAMILLSPVAGIAAVVGAGLVFAAYAATAYSQFGGTTGDLAGWFTQICELASVLAAVVALRVAEVL